MARNVTVGRDVLYTLDTTSRFRHPHDVRPAKVVAVWNRGDPEQSVNLCVFIDGTNDLADMPLTMTIWKTSVKYDAAGAPGTWHWPQDEPDYEPDFPQAHAVSQVQNATGGGTISGSRQSVHGDGNAVAGRGGSASVNVH